MNSRKISDETCFLRCVGGSFSKYVQFSLELNQKNVVSVALNETRGTAPQAIVLPKSIVGDYEQLPDNFERKTLQHSWICSEQFSIAKLPLRFESESENVRWR